MNKQFRQEQILRLIRETDIYTQEELARGLKELGVRATQVTLSRDLHDLGVSKTPSGYRQMAASGGDALNSQLRRAAGDFLRDVRQAQNLLVLKTGTGGAQAVAVAIDAEGWPEVVGTLAGDDTILVVTTSTQKAGQIKDRLLKLTGQ